MNRDLYRTIAAACCYITVFVDGKVISEGTGFSINSDGQVLTALHVSGGQVPLSDKDFNDPTWRILCKFPGRPAVEYAQTFGTLSIDVPTFRKRLHLDFAVLHPRSGLANWPFIPVSEPGPQLGQDVILAGFSEEVVLPFEFDRLLRTDVKGFDEFKTAMEEGYAADMGNLMSKRGHVGNVRYIVAGQQGLEDLSFSVFYVDNGMHSGASGGPVVGENGVIGLITDRAVTDASQASHPKLIVPSGSTLCLGLEPFKWMCRRSHGL